MKEYDPTWGYPLQQRQEASSPSGTTYTELRLASLLAAAGGTAATADGLAAAEVCAGLWGRAFASAELEPAGPAVSGLTASLMEMVGRALILRGEMVFDAYMDRGALAYLPAAWTDVSGNPSPRSWRYQVTLSGPSTTFTRTVPASRVLHFRYAAQESDPWRGRSPLATHPETAGLAAVLERRLREEAGAPVGRLIPLPSTVDEDEFQATLSQLQGRTVLVPTTAGGWDAGPAETPRQDWQPHRLGASPPDALVALRSEAGRHVLAACGVPIELIERADGTGLREAWRQFLFGTLAPVGRLIEAELSAKLERDVRLSWRELRASDLSGRARAFQSMVGGGMDVSQAAALSGLLAE